MVFLNDQLVAAGDARVSVYDRGFTSGDGVFETLKVIDGRPFAQTRHLDRLAASLRIVGMPPMDSDRLRFAIGQTIAANRERIGPVGRLRVTVTPGAPASAAPLSRSDDGPTLVITADPQPPHPADVSLLSVEWPHNERGPLVGAKTTSYAANLTILEWVKAQGADEALIYDTQGRLCEATTANVVIESGGQLCTPTLATGCLAGVTRALALEWGLITERDLDSSDVHTASEVLICSSTRDLIAARTVDGRTLTTPGPLSARAIEKFHAHAAQHIDP